MARLIIAIILLIANITPILAEPRIIEEKPLPNQLGNYRHIRVNLEDRNIDLYVATLNDNYQANIFLQPIPNQFFAKSLDELAISEKAIVAINGGFYTRNFQPAGLFIQNNITLRKLSKERLLATCVKVNGDKLLLETQRENCLDAANAMQTGPLLINDGKEDEAIKLLQQRAAKLKTFFDANRRTVLAQANDHKLVVITTSPCSLADLTQILKDYPSTFGVNRIITAINLDGGSSTGMYIRFNADPFYFSELKNVKTFIFFK